MNSDRPMIYSNDMACRASATHSPQGKMACSLYSDDTQMAVALAHGLLSEPDYENYSGVRRAFIDWYQSPENNRAPGNACLSGCGRLVQGTPWYQAGASQSKGAGCLMRVFPVGALYRDHLDAVIAVSADQAIMTHGHPTGVLSAVLGAYVIQLILTNQPADLTLHRSTHPTVRPFPKREGRS